MDQVQALAQEPPLPSLEASFPTRAFGYDTSCYRQFLQALLDGLRMYETSRTVGRAHAQEPIPAA
jgi:hypothetical protein